MELTELQGSWLCSKDCAIPVAPAGLVGHREDALALHCLRLPASGFFTSAAESLRALVLNPQELWLFQNVTILNSIPTEIYANVGYRYIFKH